jgi:hypothetical protein
MNTVVGEVATITKQREVFRFDVVPFIDRANYIARYRA